VSLKLRRAHHLLQTGFMIKLPTQDDVYYADNWNIVSWAYPNGVT
jgi:hypothetical protein